MAYLPAERALLDNPAGGDTSWILKEKFMLEDAGQAKSLTGIDAVTKREYQEWRKSAESIAEKWFPEMVSADDDDLASAIRQLAEDRLDSNLFQLAKERGVSADEAYRIVEQDFYERQNPRTRLPKQFPYAYAAYLKANFPDIWRAGGNIRGNDTFRWWTAYRRGDRSPTVMHWWNVTRPAWIARHFRDHRLPGVIAQIKWGTVGTLGVAGMKRVVEDAIRKRYAD
jgi:hypothetical protein